MISILLKKYRYTKNGYNYDFDFIKSVDNQNHGNSNGEMKLKFVTEAMMIQVN